VTRRTWFPCLVVAALASACHRASSDDSAGSAKFGVFFGGQIEERRDIPFELDPSKQTQGFRVDFGTPLARDAEVVWNIDMPASAQASKAVRAKGAPRVEAHRKSISGKATIRAGLSRFDQVTPFEPGDPLGLWNARVTVGGKVLIDRPYEVYDRGERIRAATTDAGRR
jgi:hypothetical protein